MANKTAIHTGGNDVILMKFYSLLAKQDSLFYLHDVQAMPNNVFRNSIAFKSANRLNTINHVILFEPSPQTSTVYFNKDKILEIDSQSKDGVNQHIYNIRDYCQNKANKNKILFVLPLTECSNEWPMVTHNVLLCIDYDPCKREVSPIIYDSIGRDTLMEGLSSWWQQKKYSTADEGLNQLIQEIFSQTRADKEIRILDDNTLNVQPLRRHAYNLQNRVLDGNCTAYTFRCLSEVIFNFIHNEPIKIEKADFLTDAHIREMEECINFRQFTIKYVLEELFNLGSGKVQSPPDIPEFISVLQAYVKLRSKEEEEAAAAVGKQSYYTKIFNSVKSKSNSIEAAQALIDILQHSEEGWSMEQLEEFFNKHLAVLNNSDTKELIAFYMKALGYKNLQDVFLGPQTPDHSPQF